MWILYLELLLLLVTPFVVGALVGRLAVRVGVRRTSVDDRTGSGVSR